MRQASCWLVAVAVVLASTATSSRASAEEIAVAPAASLQAAIDKAPPGATLKLAEGKYPEGLYITKPITLLGAGWEKTSIGSDRKVALTQRQKDEFFAALDAAKTRQERMEIAVAMATRETRPTVVANGVRDVTLRGLRFRGSADVNERGEPVAETMVSFVNASGTISECAIVGPFGNGVALSAGSEVRIEKSLVAGMWGIGVSAAKGSKLAVSESDIRNCYHRCITLATNDARIERCRISGSAWHGVRYDGVSPTIQHNLIFGNARFGIYAAGGTKAIVHGNVLARNEMSGMICWDAATDSIEGNTVVDNVGQGIVVNGEAKPTLLKNLIAGSPCGVWCGQATTATQATIGPGAPVLERNLFWRNAKDLGVMEDGKPLPAGNVVADPKFVAAEKRDYTLAADSPARKMGAGVADPITMASPFPIQPEEKAMIPDSETRDYSKWKKVATAR